MSDNGGVGNTLLDQGLAALQELVGPGWRITPLAEPDSVPTAGFDALVQLEPPSGGVSAELLVEAKERVNPRAVEEQLLPVVSTLRLARARQTVLLISRWIAPRTQHQLQEHGISYVDLTGNVDLRIDQPSIILHTEGSTKPPRESTPTRATTTLAGSKAGRLVRFLADFEPPYRATDIARVARLSASYVSKLLDQLQEQLLIRRDSQRIVTVDWAELLRARASTYDLLAHNPHVGMIAPNGIPAALGSLRDRIGDMSPVAITGPFAAHEVAPLAVGGQLMLYVEPGPRTPDEVGDRLGLFRVDEGANVLLLRARDNVVFERTRHVDGVPHVALSQLVLDSLAGPGRMPAEAEAVLNVMTADTLSWRRRKVPGTAPSTGQ